MLVTLTREDRLALPDGTAFSTAKAVNDVLGLRDDDRYAEWLDQEWQELAPSRAEIAMMLGPARKGNAEAHLRDDLAALAGVASRSGETLDVARLAPLLSQVRRFPHQRAIEVPSLAVLAAWALEREVDRGADIFLICPTCGRPWFARTLAAELNVKTDLLVEHLAPRRCPRPAPGLTMTCAQLDAQDRFARERSEWSKEYRKVMARKQRGTVSEKDFRAWKAVSRPGKRGEDWIPFDEWKEKHDG